jgi:hypothetical protein
MVGDGSYNDILGFGAGACIVSSSDSKEYIIAGGPTPGPISTQSPFRSEVGTLVSMGMLSYALAQLTNSHPPVVVACDNDQALARPFLPKSQISAKHNSADLISLAHDIWQCSSSNPIPSKVKGHADQLNRELSLLETLNCTVDQKAKEYLSLRTNQVINSKSDYKYGIAHISFEGEDITGKVSHTIQSLQALQRSKKAGIRTGQFTAISWMNIDLRAIARSSAYMSTFKLIFRTKWISKQLPVGSVMKQRQHRLFDNCPICLQPQETLTHLTLCPSQDSIQNYISCLTQMSNWMQQVDTDPVIRHHLISLLSILRTNQYCRPYPYPCILTKRQHYDTFKHQETIGWEQFSQGLLSQKWASLQQDYYNSIHSRRNGLTWASQLISQLWELNLQIWLYRNDKLHSNSLLLQQLNGQSYLDHAITQEFCHGKGNLPMTFSPFFLKYTQQTLLDLPIETKIAWFRTIRTAREDSGSDFHDEFSDNPALRGWIGLRPI